MTPDRQDRNLQDDRGQDTPGGPARPTGRADVMVSNAMAEASAKHLLEAYGPPSAERQDEADTSDEA